MISINIELDAYTEIGQDRVVKVTGLMALAMAEVVKEGMTVHSFNVEIEDA